jgi:flagellar hook-associated protein 1 FlgK
MADLLSTAISGLAAFQRELDVTSHNISNVATDGYSRQRAELVTNTAQPYGSGWVGSGVSVSTVTRTYDDYLAQQVRSSSSTYQRSNEFATDAAQVANMFADSTAGLSATLQKFSTAVHDMANSPTSTAPRQVVLSQTQALTSQLQQYQTRLTTLDGQINSRIQTTVNDINSTAAGIAQLNAQIAQAYGTNGQPPNDLLDQRDKLLDQLSASINVTATTQSGHMLNVNIGNGQPLVTGGQAATLATKQDPYNPTRSAVILQNGTGSTDVTSSMTGGTLGGMLDFRSQVLDPAYNSLGLISVGVASVVNQQQNVGMDLNANLGKDLFAVGGVQVLQNANNASSATVAVTRSSVSALTGSDYFLQNTASGWSLTNAITGANVPVTGTGTSASPLQADGLSIVVTGAAATGDKFLVRPTATATAGLTVLLTDPAQIAAASPIKTATAAQNTGTATISAPMVTNVASAQLRTTATLKFLTPTTYSINGSGTFSYTSGQPISANGWQVSISGTPAVGDTFTVSDNAGAVGDNSNALKLAAAFDQPVLNGGKDSVNVSLGRFIGNIGTVTKQAQNDSAAQKAVNTSAVQSRTNSSGVNLDEEASNLIRYQQAYQATARLISVVDNLFNTLIAATKGQ